MLAIILSPAGKGFISGDLHAVGAGLKPAPTSIPNEIPEVTTGIGTRLRSGLRLRLLHSVGRLADDHAVVQGNKRLEVPEEQERSEINLHVDHVTRQFGQGQHLHAIEPMRLVFGSVPPVHPGIDRYLNGTAGSRRVLQEINRDPASLALYVLRRRLAQNNFHHCAPTLYCFMPI